MSFLNFVNISANSVHPGNLERRSATWVPYVLKHPLTILYTGTHFAWKPIAYVLIADSGFVDVLNAPSKYLNAEENFTPPLTSKDFTARIELTQMRLRTV
jgi:hypothetical protein